MSKNKEPIISDTSASKRDKDSRPSEGEQFTSDAESQNKLNLEEFRLSQDFPAIVGVRKKIITVPVRKPDRQWFVRTHPSSEYRLETAILELKDDRETYLIERSLWPELPGEILPTVLFTAINRQGVVFLWPVRLPDPTGRQLQWHISALDSAQVAMDRWVRVVANMSLGAYELQVATGDLPEPEWPNLDFDELLGIAFRDRFIRSLEHPAVQKLRGQF